MGIFIFIIRHSLSQENCSDFQKNGFSIFWKSIAFFENIVQCKNIQFTIRDKKVYIHFCRKLVPFPKNGCALQNLVRTVFMENNAVLKKLFNEKIFTKLLPTEKVII